MSIETISNHTKSVDRLSSEPSYSQEIILCPNISLSENEKIKLAQELTPITAQGFMQDVTTNVRYEALYDDVYNHVIPCDKLCVYRSPDKKSVLAFISVTLKGMYDVNLYHLEGMIVAPSMHGKGFSQEILKNDLQATNANILAFHTQSLLMENLGKKVSTFNIQLANEIATVIETRNLVILQDGPIDKGRYAGHSLYGDLNQFDKIAIKKPGFDYKKGDAIIFAGVVNR